MNVDFSKYDIQKLSVIGVVTNKQLVVSSSDLEQIVRDAFEQGAEEARKWSVP